MAGNQVGLNGIEAAKCLQSIETDYTGLMNYLQDGYQGVISSLGQGWFGQDAVNFGHQNFEPALLEIGSEINHVVQSVHDTITQNATNFDNHHQTHVFHDPGHHQVNPQWDLSMIKPDENGYIGILGNHLNHAASLTQPICKNISSSLDAIKSAAARSGFYGEGQQEKLSASIAKIKQSIEQINQEMTKAIKTKLETVEQDEKSLAQKNASTF